MAGRILTTTTAAFFLCAVGFSTITRSARLPFRFSHKLHIEEVGAECADCHEAAGAATATDANLLPAREICTDCHDDSEIDAFGYAGAPAPERELIFSHAGHMKLAGMECTHCHSSIANAQHPPSGLPEMACCIDCHTARETNTGCNICHAQVALRRPADHVADWVLDHVEVARGDENACARCHSQTYCQECHDGAALVIAVAGESATPIAHSGPLATAHSGNDLLILQRAHDLNYRYTHGTEVNTKTSDCAACHETTEFCVTCHTPEDDQNRYQPIWHGLSGFKDQLHAEMARNDIEGCASCHDVSGAEPTCLRCHQKTESPHADGFMENVQGDWHNQDDAVCFVCHVNTHVAGAGFCGKCHGAEGD